VRDKYVRRIEKLANMSGSATDAKDAANHAPPEVRFVWGKMSFRGVVTSLAQKYTMFLSDGTPVRCDVDLTLMNVETLATDKGTDIVSQAVSSTPYTVKPRDRLDLIAANKLGDANRWREIAELNGIENSVDLSPYTSIQIPSS
jgi:nucleoid-associated protein YgaU